MKKLALALIAALAFGASASAQVPSQGPNNAIMCNASAIYSNTTAGGTIMVPGVAGKIIYVCGYILQAGGTTNALLTTGTGAACGTATVSLTPTYNFTIGLAVQDVAGFFRGMLTPAGNSLCVASSAGVSLNAIVYYGQY